MYKLLFNTIIAFLVFAAIACNKEEGIGGEATIKGQVILREYDHEFTSLQRQIPAFDEDVYIQYGTKDGVGDKVVTDLNGNYRFEYLLPGNYTIYVYSEDSVEGLNTKLPISYTVSVDGKETSVVPQIVKYRTLDIDEGTGSISGTVKVINWYKNFFQVKDTSMAQELDVYLIYGNHKTFDLRSRTNFDGSYEFPNLVNGTYTVYVYSENKNGATQLIPVKDSALIINSKNQDLRAKELVVEYQQ